MDAVQQARSGHPMASRQRVRWEHAYRRCTLAGSRRFICGTTPVAWSNGGRDIPGDKKADAGESALGSSTDPGKADRELVRVLESYRRDLTRFANWLARDPTVAEDIVQETMLRAWRARSGLRDLSAVRTWLFTIVRREHARLYERKQLPLVDIHECMARDDEGLALYAEEPQINELRRAILTLSDEYRVPLVMQVLGGFTTAEIASELGITASNVLTRLFRARNKLREIYSVSSLDADVEPQGAA